MPDCVRHKLPCDEQGNCPRCVQQDEADLAREDERYSAFLAYTGDTFLVDSYVKDGLTSEQAEEQVRDKINLGFILELQPELILKDRIAREEMINRLRARDPYILFSWYNYGEENKPKLKRGPKPNRKTRIHKKNRAKELRDQGVSIRKISYELYDGGYFPNRVHALLSLPVEMDNADQ